MIKLTDKKVAKQLKKSGFAFAIEKVNIKNTLFVFEESDELKKLLNEKFASLQLITDETLKF